MTEHRFTVTREAEALFIGALDDAPRSGAFLSPEFPAELQRAQSATKARNAQSELSQLPDALRDLIGLVVGSWMHTRNTIRHCAWRYHYSRVLQYDPRTFARFEIL
jgi:hypothetical protein